MVIMKSGSGYYIATVTITSVTITIVTIATDTIAMEKITTVIYTASVTNL